MKYLLVDKLDNICGTTHTDKLENAKHYFMGRKRIDEANFDSLWRVMSEKEYDTTFRSSLHNRQIEWWKEDKEITDDELKN
tara:strand:- start:192 stop:434 length:243 start_codon:yes stop_codon:yes gene_type:complete